MARALGYIRVSTQSQYEKGISLEVQEQEIRAFCENKGHDLVDIYIDRGVSGGRHISTRPEGAKFMERLFRGDIDLMVITRLDRAWRSAIDTMSTVEKMNKAKIGLVILRGFNGEEPIDTTSPMGSFILGVMSMFAQLEKDMSSLRTREVIQAKKMDLQLYSSEPLGFSTTEDKRLKVNPEEMRTVRLIYKLREDGYSLRGITKYLNDHNIPSKTGSKFYPTTVSLILNNDIFDQFLNE